MTLLRTAFSPIVRECGDLSAGVFDLEGRMLAQAVTGTPGPRQLDGQVGRATSSPRFPLATMQPGDVYITNDPWLGTGHLHDFVLVTPAFHRGRLVGAVRLHQPSGRHRRHRLRPRRQATCSRRASAIPMLKLARRRPDQRDPARDRARQLARARSRPRATSIRSPTATTPVAGAAGGDDDRVRPRRTSTSSRGYIVDRSRAADARAVRALPQGHLALPDDARRLRPADRAGRRRSPSASDGDRGRLRRHLARVALRHQRAQDLLRGLYRLRPRLRRSRRRCRTTRARSRLPGRRRPRAAS